MEKSFAQGALQCGFAKAGIYPYDPRAVDENKLLGSSPSLSSNNELGSAHASVVIHQPARRLTRSASRSQLSTESEFYKLFGIFFIVSLYLTTLNSSQSYDNKPA